MIRGALKQEKMQSSRYLIRLGRSTLRTSGHLRGQLPATTTQLISTRQSQKTIAARPTIGILSAQKSEFSTHQADASSAVVSDVTLDNDDGMLLVKWGDGERDRYPYIWLRDNCQCPGCFHPSSQSKTILLQELHLSVHPQSLTVERAGGEIEIDWSDGHRSSYSADWLQERSFNDVTREKHHQFFQPKHSFWGSDMMNRIPQGSFVEVLKDDQAFLIVLQKLEEFGLVILQDAKKSKGQLQALADRIGFLRKTVYGETFTVEDKVAAQSLAYTSKTLDMHMDFPSLNFKPEIQVLHCIAQTPGEGGETLFVDAFNVAYRMKDLHPEKFQILTNTPVYFKNIGIKENGIRNHALTHIPMIGVDQHGIVRSVNSIQIQRDSYFNIPVEKVRCWYDAMLTFHDLLSHKDYLVSYKMNEGDVVLFDNSRLMHGRTGYEAKEGSRLMEGGYFDWDMVRSCRRVLQTKLKVI